ncbi:MAG: hypothetical protein KAU21_14875, partial [Gammaproteobacteria bacterium]|nr:hypothetical protein [Gammaproteobacteria bacterium]
ETIIRNDGWFLMKALSKEDAKLLASYLMSLSLFALSGAIVYFTYQMSVISKQIPDILISIDNTSEKIEPVIDEVSEIVALVPPILKEVEETRKLIPPILKEVEQTRKLIPAVLAESEAIRGELPAVLASADKASAAVHDVAEQVEATRPLIPEVIKEVEATRESIPPMMDRADVLIEKERVAGKEASQGAVTGFFSGLIMAPFALVADAGRGIAGLTEKEAESFEEVDLELNKQAALYLLNNGAIGERSKWNNPDTDSHGIVTLTKTYSEGEYSEYDCRTLATKMFNKDELIKDISLSFCKNDEGKWDYDE